MPLRPAMARLLMARRIESERQARETDEARARAAIYPHSSFAHTINVNAPARGKVAGGSANERNPR